MAPNLDELERPRVQVRRIVDSLTSGVISDHEPETELKAVENDERLLVISTGVAASLLGLISGGLLDGTLASGNAPWAGPLGYTLLGGAAYYGATQTKNAEVTEFLTSVLGRPTLLATIGALASIQSTVLRTKAAAIKKVQVTIDDIVKIPYQIRDSVVEAKDEAVSAVKAVPDRLQSAAIKSYEETKQNAVQKVEETKQNAILKVEETKQNAIQRVLQIKLNIITRFFRKVAEVTSPSASITHIIKRLVMNVPSSADKSNSGETSRKDRFSDKECSRRCEQKGSCKSDTF